MTGGLFRGLDPRRYHRNVQRYVLFGIFYFFGFGLFFLLYNLYLLRLGFREDFIGQLAGMSPLASGLFAIPIGIWSDRIDRRPFLVVAALLLAVSQVVLCLSASSAVLLACAFLGGISSALVFVNHVPYLAENSRPRERGQVLAIGYSTQVLTRMVVSLVGGSLPALIASFCGVSTDRPEPFRYALLIGAGLTALAAVPLLGVRRGRASVSKPTPSAVTPAERADARKVLTLLTVNNAFKGAAFGISFPFFNVFFQETLLASGRGDWPDLLLRPGRGAPQHDGFPGHLQAIRKDPVPGSDAFPGRHDVDRAGRHGALGGRNRVLPALLRLRKRERTRGNGRRDRFRGSALLGKDAELQGDELSARVGRGQRLGGAGDSVRRLRPHVSCRGALSAVQRRPGPGRVRAAGSKRE